ncbi:MAG: twin-arginine translocase TatA/TatE family subunit [Eubacteriales bacterium]
MLIGFGFITPVTAGIVLVVALIVFGPGKLPSVGKALGRGIKEFKNETEGVEKKVEEDEKKEDTAKKNIED